MSEPQEMPSASSCSDDPASVAAASADGVAQALDKNAEERRNRIRSAEEIRISQTHLPEEVIYPTRNKISSMFFLEDLSLL